MAKDQYPPTSSGQTYEVIGPKPRRGRKLLLILLVLLLIGGAGFGGWYYQQRKINEQDLRIDQLQADNDKLKQEQQEQAAAGDASQPAVYSAEVGKFTLTLSNDYAIVEELDGGFEGGPATQLLIAKKTAIPNVFDGYVPDQVEVFAKPLSGQNYQQTVESELSDDTDPTKGAALTIDGVTAETYTSSGLFSSKFVFFTKNNIFYKISLTNSSDKTEQILKDIVSGFKFN